ncbi:NBR1-Ig-like domain-containing protein [Actinocorallia lasiicapitis]
MAPKRFRLTRPVVVGLVTAAVGVGAVAVILVSLDSGADDWPTPPPVAQSPAVCPIVSPNPAAAPPLHRGDAANFLGDVTLTDCTRVPVNTTVPKTWRLMNTGTVPWKGYHLRRIDSTDTADQCRTPTHVPIKDTRPGATVDITTDITTPPTPSFCYVRFKVIDAAGRFAFPASRPLNFQLLIIPN